MSELFNKFSGTIERLSHRADDSRPVHDFRLWKNDQKHLECFYAPFEHVNTSAKLVLIGITPGRTQMNRALNAAGSSIKARSSIDKAVTEVKRAGSFSGSMRPNIVNTLNKLGYQNRLGIRDSSDLWGTKNNLVNFCSLLKYPVFIRGKDYNGKPNPFKVRELENLLIDGFAKDLQSISPTAELIPLGDFVADVISELDRRNLIPQKITRFEGKIVAPPHPSGANAESIALLLSDTYPEKSQYLESKYREYLSKRGWEKRANGKPQTEAMYKAARASRWESMLFVRRAYGINA